MNLSTVGHLPVRFRACVASHTQHPERHRVSSTRAVSIPILDSLPLHTVVAVAVAEQRQRVTE